MARSSFEIQKLNLPGVLLIQPKRWEDERGFFMETFHKEALMAAGITDEFVQDNLSYSKKNVLRGLHYQKAPHAQVKLIRCVSGKIFDVVADYDPASATFGTYVSTILSGDTQAILYVPKQYVHGACVLSDEAILEYKVDDYYYPECVAGVRYDDPAFNITWPVENPILSEQDKSWQLLPKRRS